MARALYQRLFKRITLLTAALSSYIVFRATRPRDLKASSEADGVLHSYPRISLIRPSTLDIAVKSPGTENVRPK